MHEAAALAVADTQGKLVRVDPGFCALLGYEEQEILGRTVADITHPDDRARNMRLVRDLVAGRTPGFVLEKRYLRRDGSPIWVRNSVTLVHDEAGRPFRVVALVEDLAREHMARSLLEGQTRVLEDLARGRPLADVLHALARFMERHSNGMLASILVLDDEGRLRHGAAPSLPPDYNQAIDGLEPGAAVGSCGTAAYRGERVVVEDTFASPLWEEWRDVARAYSLRACWSTPIRGSDGAVLGTFALYYREPRAPTPRDLELIDVATHLAGLAIERARSDARLRELNAKLERRVAERTRQLIAANQELEAFSYRVAHDLRAPLRGMRALAADALEDHASELSDDVLTNLRSIDAAAEQMGNLIQDILALSMATHREVAREPVDVTALARLVAADLRRREAERRVDIHIQEGLRAHADPRLLRIALENLLGNAWKFTRESPLPRIEVASETQDGRTVFVVRDNGTGFDMARADRLFQAFERLHTGSRFEGTGIGLATVRRIVEQHGGRIWADAAPGKGAAFFFTLPDGGGASLLSSRDSS